ncbi:hypothetical protein [Streptomyces sp. NPDC012825]|uniref:hypothetical protein n=1 Tax=Streptomyces sp. NPDC012825 TaxID=3364851 RepID=UPI00369F7740
MNRLDVVRALGIAAPPRPEGTGYGQVVPEDFELLVAAVPEGAFAGAVLLERPAELPVRSLDAFTRATASRVEDMARALLGRERGPPLPLHPEPGGMVPWGRTSTDGVPLWDTTAPDPADWTTVVTDKDFQSWIDLPFSAPGGLPGRDA